MRTLLITTRQWNPGDEFILAGCRHILDACGIDRPVEAIYNRNPQITSFFERCNFWKRPYLKPPLSALDFALNITHYDNSFKSNSDIDIYDLVVFAGSPEWFGGRIQPLIAKLEQFKGKIVYFGIGTPNRKIALTTAERHIMQRALVTCRDQALISVLKDNGIIAQHLPCPALLSSPFERKPPDRLGLIGLGFNISAEQGYHGMKDAKVLLQARIFEEVAKRHPTRIICHYISELEFAAAQYGIENVIYRYDARDYPVAYAPCDYVISSRVHGCGVSSSLGIPNSMIGHDKRASTVDGFLSTHIDENSNVAAVLKQAEAALAEVHAGLVRHKRETLEAYVTHLKIFLGI